jgi:SAM-dependent methyltransferase
MTKKFLHVGCGPQTKKNLRGFDCEDWREIRFDINEKVNPDIVGTMTDMSMVKSGSFDAIYSSHNLEHLFAHEVTIALKEFNRILSEDGFVVLTCPDLQSVCEAVVKDELLEPLYNSPAGPISAIDILYGHRGFISQGNTYMAHKCGFTRKVLDAAFGQAGFRSRLTLRRPEVFDLWIVAFKSEQSNEERARKFALNFFP